MFNLGGATAAFTTRRGGVSVAPYSYLNLANHVGDDPVAVKENRKRLADAIGTHIAWMNQIHSDHVHIVRPGHVDAIPKADALVIDTRMFNDFGLEVPAAAVMVADCVPLLLASGDGRIMAAVHVGRAGLMAGMVRRVLGVISSMGVAACELHAAIGPSICGKCYEVPGELQRHVCQAHPCAWSQTRWGTSGLDISSAVYSLLLASGITVAFRSKRCTFEDPSLFSYRRCGTTGRFVGIVAPARG